MLIVIGVMILFINNIVRLKHKKIKNHQTFLNLIQILQQHKNWLSIIDANILIIITIIHLKNHLKTNINKINNKIITKISLNIIQSL